MPTAWDEWQRTFIRNATLFRSKQELRSVEISMVDSSPTIVHGYMFEGTVEPPSSKPLFRTSSAHSPPAPAWFISCQGCKHNSSSLPINFIKIHTNLNKTKLPQKMLRRRCLEFFFQLLPWHLCAKLTFAQHNSKVWRRSSK